MKKLFLKIWKDPVGSKLIATLIMVIGSSVLIFLKSLTSNESFISNLSKFLTYNIPFWLVFSSILLLYLVYQLWIYFIRRRLPQFEYDEETLKLDRFFFERIRNDLLPQNTAIGFLRHNNFAGYSFDTKMLEDLDRFEHESTKSDFEFLNPQLETIKQQLLAKVDHFTTLIAVETLPTNNGRKTVPPEWELEKPERFKKVVKSIHTTKHEICTKYDELIRTGRRVLKV